MFVNNRILLLKSNSHFLNKWIFEDVLLIIHNFDLIYTKLSTFNRTIGTEPLHLSVTTWTGKKTNERILEKVGFSDSVKEISG